MRLSVTLFLVAAVAVANAQLPLPPQTRMGIIGAGAAGISTAVKLREMGYESVTIIEKESKVGGVAESFLHQGKIYDTATMFVPGGSFVGEGVEPTLQKYMSYSREFFTEAVNFDFVDAQKAKTAVPSELRNAMPDEVIIEQLLTGTATSIQYVICGLTAAAQGVQATCESCGICDSFTEGLLEWGARTGLIAYATLASAVIDGLGANPGALVSARLGLKTPFVAVDAMYAAKELGLTKRQIRRLPFPEQIRDILLELYKAPRWFSFVNGYESFFESLIINAGVKVERNSQVDQLTPTMAGDQVVGWTVTTSNPLDSGADPVDHVFDILIVATAPLQAMSFLPDSEQRNVLAKAIPQSPPNDVFLAEAEFDDEADQDNTFSYWPSGLGLGSPEIIFANVGGPVKPFFWVKRHSDRNIVTVATATLTPNSPADLGLVPFLDPDAAFEACKAFGAQMGIHLKTKLEHRRYLFPSSTSDPEWARWPELQGQNRTFFTGEAFAGSGIPAITFYTERFWDFVFVNHGNNLVNLETESSQKKVRCASRYLGIQIFVFAAAAGGSFLVGRKTGARNEKRKSKDMTNQLAIAIAEQNSVEKSEKILDADFDVEVQDANGISRTTSI